MAIRFGANSGLTMDGVADDLEFETNYTLDGSFGITDSPYEAAYWVYDHSWSNPQGPGVEVFLLMSRSASTLGSLALVAVIISRCHQRV